MSLSFCSVERFTKPNSRAIGAKFCFQIFILFGSCMHPAQMSCMAHNSFRSVQTFATRMNHKVWAG
jgi:hypothetical protein